ncbi:MAG: asparagine synthase C-terminal domain-containing protein, partial [Planctomycetes bacterium]|nr:asparagine synthase C-terminal domain-containing protein [Planctomycetota bacterium]
QALDEYLSLGYVPAPRTGFQGVFKLPPGHYLRFHKSRLEIQPYWRLSCQPSEEFRDFTREELVEKTRDLLDEAVRLRLKSDVPLGVCLSGGIDSSGVAALMARHSSSPIKTFSIGFADRHFDESRYARRVVEHLGADHHEWIVEPDALSLLPEMVKHYNEPFADSSALPCFYLARLAAGTVKVVLGGDGGDECFAGYDRYRAAALAGWLDFLPRSMVRLLSRSGVAVVSPLAGRHPGKARHMQRFFHHLPEPPVKRYHGWVGCLTDLLKEKLYTREFSAETGSLSGASMLAKAYQESDSSDLIERFVQTDLKTYLPGDLLVKVDRAFMAYGLEGRSPFLDHKLVEFAAALPMHLKLRGRTSKFILKEALRPLLPGAVIDRAKKGFGVPIHAWLRGVLKEPAFDLLTGPRAASRGIFNTDAVRDLLQNHMAGKVNLHHEIWALLMLELWHRAFIDGSGV